MNTIGEYIAAVKQALNVQSDDTTVHDRFVFFVLKNMRATLLRQEANKDNLWDGFNAQVLPDFELKRGTVSETDRFDANIVVFKSVEELPELIDTQFGKIINGVYFDNGEPLHRIEYSDWRAAQKRRNSLPTKGASYFPRNNRLYVVDFDGLADCIQVFIEAPFSNPEDLGDACSDVRELPFNLPTYLADRVIKMTVDFIRGKYGIPADTRNNAKEDIAVANNTQS
jgi:hypothetical protein